jgi:simple sugar transport system permease protein
MSQALPAIPPTTPFRPTPVWQRIFAYRLIWPILALIGLLLFNVWNTPTFFHLRLVDGHLYGSLIDVLAVGAPTAIVAIGMTMVIATGGVDLSVGSVMAIANAIASLLIVSYNWSFFPAAIVALLISAIIGLWNGLLVSVAGIQPIVATLIMMVAGRGIAQLVTDGQKINFDNATYVFLGNGFWLGLPFGIWLVAATFLIVALATRKTALGLAIEAVGDAPSASRYAGLQVGTIKVSAYIASAICAGMAGLLVASRIRTADPINAGLNAELDAIFAVVVGGTALAGGRFTLAGSVLGAMLLQTLGTTLLSTRILGHDVSPEYLPLPKAVVIVFVCLLQSSKFRDAVARPFRSRGKPSK